MWKMMEKPKTVLASKSLIQEFVEMEPAPYDRPLSERRLQVYERILNSGDFRPVTWASVHCKETNSTYRVNGKHTSILLSKKDPIPTFYVTVERWEADTLNDVAALYNTFDSNLASRTTNDVNAAFAATLPELREIPARLINLAVTAAANLKWSDREIRTVSPAERAEELLDRVPFVRWLRSVITTVDTRASHSLCRHLVRSACVQAMMATYDKAPRLAEHFWVMVRDESAADRDDPTRVLARYLVRSALNGRRGATDGQGGVRKAVSHREMYVKCIHAWNAWRKEESTSLNYHADAPIPNVLK